MKRRIDHKSRQRTHCPQVLLTKALVAVIHASAQQIHPSVFQEIVRDRGAEQGRLAASEWLLRHGTLRRCDTRACVQCLKAIGQQCGWTIRVTVESDDAFTIIVQECQFTESRESGLYLCELAAGLFAGVVAETLGYAKICADQCSATPPLGCVFTIYLRESEGHAAIPDIIHQYIVKEPVLYGDRLSDGVPVERLTQREQQILQLIAQGFSDKQIAGTLQRSVRTVENHAARIRQKLRIGNRTGLVRFAFRNRLIES
ncbi:MAG TPA: response regulator transcription factor [Patescibacteria group bacterium]|nr:response regulator transcription factor [Patescibacteria group bacterium]